MEILNERIKEWLKVEDGDGFCFGSGSSFGGDGSGYGDGNGNGSGYGDGSGFGTGDGYGSGLKSVNGQYIWIIDNMQTIITAISKNVAKGFILNNDLTLSSCYIVKGHNKFAHGKTIKKAMIDLEEKIFKDMDIKEILQEFRSKFSKDKKYKGTTFYKWHHNLTGSCEMGRNNFVKNHNLNLNKLYSVKEFIELTENDYGGEIIKQLKEYYK